MDGDMLGLTIMDCPELKRCPILINFHSDFNEKNTILNGKITIFNRTVTFFWWENMFSVFTLDMISVMLLRWMAQLNRGMICHKKSMAPRFPSRRHWDQIAPTCLWWEKLGRGEAKGRPGGLQMRLSHPISPNSVSFYTQIEAMIFKKYDEWSFFGLASKNQSTYCNQSYLSMRR